MNRSRVKFDKLMHGSYLQLVHWLDFIHINQGKYTKWTIKVNNAKLN